MKANVYVTLKPGVLDPQGQAVHKTLEQLGFSGVENVRIGKFVEIELAGSRESRLPSREMLDALAEQVAEMCQRLLANPVLEEYRVEIAASEQGGP